MDDALPCSKLPPLPLDATPAVKTVVEQVSSEFLKQEAEQECIKISELRKEFNTPDGVKVAVRGLNLSVYRDQIFVLLGHNGAGTGRHFSAQQRSCARCAVSTLSSART